MPQENIRLYWARYEEQMYLRYGEHIQKIDEKLETNWLPEMYFEDLDNDGDRELVVIYNTGHGTSVYTNALTVYEWDGESWTWTTHDPLELIEDFNRQRDYAFYEDGTAYINYNGLDLLLDLSLLWESDYWGGAAPEICELSQYQINYTKDQRFSGFLHFFHFRNSPPVFRSMTNHILQEPAGKSRTIYEQSGKFLLQTRERFTESCFQL